jgi:hypothetical protein
VHGRREQLRFMILRILTQVESRRE